MPCILGGNHGHPDEGEDIRVAVLPYPAALAALRAGEFESSPTIIALQWLALNRRRLRAKWSGSGALTRDPL